MRQIEIVPGDQWEAIAAKNCVSVESLLLANGRNPDASNLPPDSSPINLPDEPPHCAVAPDTPNVVALPAVGCQFCEGAARASLLEGGANSCPYDVGGDGASEGAVAVVKDWLVSWVVERRGSLASGSLVSGYDATIRVNHYVKPAKELAERVWADLQKGYYIDKAGNRVDLTHLDARKLASGERNSLLTEVRARLSPGGKAFSEAIKDEGKSLSELVVKYSKAALTKSAELMEKYGVKTLDKASALYDAAKVEAALRDLADTPEISEAIIQAAGRTGKVVTAVARFSKYAGPVGVAVGGGTSIYEIVSAPEGQKLHAAGREMSGFAGGLAGTVSGGVVGAYAASLACGPAAPGCAIAVSFVIVGGAGYAGSKAGQAGYDEATSDDLANAVGDAIWQAAHHSAEQAGDILPPGVGDDIFGPPLFP